MKAIRNILWHQGYIIHYITSTHAIVRAWDKEADRSFGSDLNFDNLSNVEKWLGMRPKT